ncbi:hypothetical protein MHU86_2639 [Fragilaria crotonensis]|nr:hypothetical protein MHU86_2639 [Fragilaria crotonensis]
MVSDFICPCHGRLRLDGIPISVIIEPGKNHDGYWQATDILKQLKEKAIPAFNQMHPEARGLFIFDNSTNHGAYAADALVAVASKMNLGSEGKVPMMRSTVFVNGAGVEIEQTMHEDNVPKGLKKVLLERELWIEKLPKHCGAKFAIESNPACCAIHRLGLCMTSEPRSQFYMKQSTKLAISVTFSPNFTVNWPRLKTSGVMQRNIRDQTVITQLLRCERLFRIHLMRCRCHLYASTFVGRHI